MRVFRKETRETSSKSSDLCSISHFSPLSFRHYFILLVLQPTDVLKVDIGVQVSGRICDSAFTIAFDEDWNPLLEAVKAATNEGIKQAGIDARMQDIGEAIQEVMESHEFEAKGKTHKGK